MNRAGLTHQIEHTKAFFSVWSQPLDWGCGGGTTAAAAEGGGEIFSPFGCMSAPPFSSPVQSRGETTTLGGGEGRRGRKWVIALLYVGGSRVLKENYDLPPLPCFISHSRECAHIRCVTARVFPQKSAMRKRNVTFRTFLNLMSLFF